MSDAWQPDLYARFAAERRRPFDDLLGLVEPAADMRVLDLGCGTGELTRVLHDRLGARETLGLDRSAAMLERSGAHAGGGVSFERGDLGTFATGSEGGARGGWDLVFSNAALHWVDDHAALLARLTRAVAPGGQLAIQVPANFDHPSHRTADEVAAEPPFREALAGWTRGTPVLDPREYAEVLHRLGWARQHVRLVVYAHVLPGPDAVIDWVRGTLLTAFEERLGPAGYAAFLERYRARLLAALPDERPYLYGFKRILFWARR